MIIKSIGVIGGGAWGTALAETARRAGRDVVLWARSTDIVDEINRLHTNARYVPGFTLDAGLVATTDLSAAAGCDVILLVTPAQQIRDVLATLRQLIVPGTRIVLCAKGIELATGHLLDQVLAEVIPGAIAAVLSGPGFAVDVVGGLPTAVTLACADPDTGRDLSEALGSRTFRPYWSSDLIGVQLGGAVKNVLAIAAGIVAGRELGASASAALITRGFAEMRRFSDALGARPETLMGLSGFGDVVLSCSSPKSRNFAHGLALANPAKYGALPARTTEGVLTAKAVTAIARARGIDVPVANAVTAILAGTVTIEDAIAALLQRPLKAED